MSAREQIEQLKTGMQKAIVGQEAVVERLIIGLLANGNLLVEGLPGLAKTRIARSPPGLDNTRPLPRPDSYAAAAG